MRAIGEAGYVLSKSELCTLAGLAGCKKLIGIDKSYPVNEEDIIKELEKVKSGLVAKKYLQKLDEGYGIDKNISFLIKACCNPTAIVRLIECKEGSRRNRYYYFHKDVIVELDQDILNEDTCILTPIASVSKAFSNMEEFFHIEQMIGKLDSRMFDNRFSIKHDALMHLMNHEGDMREPIADSVFSEAGMDGFLNQDLIFALNQSGESYSMLLIKLGNPKTYYSSDIYAGRSFLWKITGSREHKDYDEISPGTREDMLIVAEQFIDIIKNVMA